MLKYASNVAKSVGFISIQAIKGLNPTLTSYAQDTASTIKDAYDNIKDKGSDIKGYFGDYASLAKEGLDNAFSDLKTGNWYNRDRQNKNVAAAFGFDDDDDDFFGDDDDKSSSRKSASNSSNDNSVAMAAVANTIVGTSNNSTVKLTRTARQNTQAMMMHNAKMFKSLTASVLTVNNTLITMYNDISKPLNAHIQNTYNFQLTSIDEMRKQTNYLKTIADLMQDRFGNNNKSNFGNKYKDSNWDKVFGGGQLPNIKNLFGVAKDQIFDSTGISSMVDLLFDKDIMNPKMLKSMDMFNSPIASLLAMGLSAKMRKSSFGRTVNTMVNRAPSLLIGGLHKANSWGKSNDTSIFGEIIKNITGAFIPTASKGQIDHSKYNKGRTDWTGMNDKALREVIPTQLAHILAALTGQEARIFNYSTGRWEKVSTSINKFKEEQRNAIGNASSGFLNDLKESLGNTYGYSANSSKAMQSITNDYNNLMKIIATTPGLNTKDISQLRAYLKKLGVLGRSNPTKEPLIHEENFNLIIKTINNTPGLRSRFIQSADEAVNANNKFFGSMNASGEFGTYGAVTNGSGLSGTVSSKGYGANLLNALDDKGNTIFFYLQNYYSDLKKIAHNFEMHGGRRAGVKASYRRSFDVPNNFKKSSNNKDAFENRYRTEYYSIENAENREVLNKDEQKELDKKEKQDNSFIGRLKKFFKPDDGPNIFADSITKAFESALYGKELDDGSRKYGIAGLLQSMNESIQSISTKFNKLVSDFVNNKINKVLEKGKTAFNKWKEKNPDFVNRFKKSFIDEGIPGAYKRSFTEASHDAMSSIKNSLSKYNASVSRFESSHGKKPDNSGLNYKGGMVQKTGLAAVSEGELIIPSRYNPYYKGFSSASAQRSKEGRVIDNFLSEVRSRMYGGYADGGTVEDKDLETTWNPQSYTGKAAKMAYGAAKMAAPHVKNEAINIGKDAKALGKEATKTAGIIAGRFINKVNESLDKNFGKSEIYNRIKNGANSELGKEIRKYIPEELAGGLTGAIIGGGLTGSGLGLLGGFTIGAGVNLIRKSSNIQKKLFGEEDATTGKMTGGFFNRDVATFIKKKLPKTVKPGIIGSIAGAALLPNVGVFGGFAIGAGLQLLSTTEGFKDLVLGPEGVDGKRRGGLKGVFENRVIKPLASFVNKGIDGITKYFKKNVLNPLTRLFNPLKDLTVGIFNSIGSTITTAIKKQIIEPLAVKFDKIFKPITSAVKTVGKFGLKAGGKLLSLPGIAVGAVGDNIARFNARHGYSTANAKERVRLNNSYLRNRFVNGFGLNNTKFGNWLKVKTSRNAYDEFAANDNVTSDDLQEYLDLAKSPQDYDTDANEVRQKFINKVYGSSKDGGINNKKDYQNLLKLVNSGASLDSKEVKSELAKLSNKGLFDPNILNQLTDIGSKYNTNISAINKGKESLTDRRNAFLNRLGVSEDIFKDGHSLENLRRTVNADIRYKKGIEAQNAAQAAEAAEAEKLVIDKAREENPLEAQIADNTKSILDILSTDKDREENSLEEQVADNTKSTLGVLSELYSSLTGKALPVNSSNKSTVPNMPGIPKIKPLSVTGGNGDGREVESDGETHKLGETKTSESDNGPITYVWTDAGWKVDVRDSETSETMKKNEDDRKLRNGFFEKLTSGSFFKGFKALFGIGEKPDKNDKPSFFQTMLSKIVGFGSAALGLLGALPTIAVGITGLTTLMSFLNPNKSLVEKIKDAPEAANTAEAKLLGYKRQKYNKGEYQEKYTSQRLGGIMAKRILTGRLIKSGPAIIKAPLNLAITGGHAVLNGAVNKVGKVGSSIAKNAIEKGGVLGKVFGFLQKAIATVAKKLGGNAGKEAVETATKGIFSQLLEKGGQKLAQALAKNALTVAFVVLAAENGWEDAQANLGILEKPTIGERFLSAIVAAVNELVLGIIPVPVVINIVLTIGGLFGIDVSGIREKQAAVKAEWEQWNKDHPDQAYNTVKEYLKNHYGLYTTQDRIAGAAKAVGGTVLKGAKGVVSLGKKVVGAEIGALKNTSKLVVGGAKFIGNGAISLGKKLINDKVNTFKNTGKFVSDTAKFIGKGINAVKNGDVKNWLIEKANNMLFTPVNNLFGRLGKFFGDPDKFKKENSITMLADLWKQTDPEYKGSKDTVITSAKSILDATSGLMSGKTSLVDVLISMNKTVLTTITSPVFSLIKGVRWMLDKIKKFDLVGKLKSILPGSDAEASTTNTSEDTTSTDTTTPANATGSGTHVSQYDPLFRNRLFGKSNIANNGCGPAVATTVLRSYGKNARFEDAINFAEKNGYVAGASGVSGTRASYFQDILGSNGISTSYTSNSNSIRNAIRSGSPTILLGQDRSNSSKENSPFGPNPHYVVARGTDSRGNVYIDDPELNRTALYDKSVLNSAKLGVMTGGASGADSDYIGKYVKKYESGDKGSKMISSGSGDHGGVSFGTYQFPSKNGAGNLNSFWNKFYADKFPGVTPGDNQAFKDAWLKAVDMNPSQFFKNEYSIEYGHYLNNLNSLIAKNPSFNPNTFSRGTQEAFWSSSVQYGGGKLLSDPFSQPGLSMNMDKNAALDLIYKYKIDHVDNNFKSSSRAVKNGIAKRFQNELNYLKGINNNPLAPGLVPDGEVSGGSNASSTAATDSTGSNGQGYQYKGFTLDFLKDALSVALNKAVSASDNSNGADPSAPKQQSVFGKIGGFLKGLFRPVKGFTQTINTPDNSTSFTSNSGTGESGAGDIINNFPYYNQGDPNWGQKGYGTGTIASSGCGPTSMAMVMKSYGTNVTPIDTVKYSLEHGFRTKDQGTSWDYFANIAKANGLTTEQYSGGQKGIEVTKAKLLSNIPVIGSMRPGDFTKGGHFVVFSGLDSDGTLRVNDPSSRARSVKKWDPQVALGQAKQFWAISKNGQGSIKLNSGSGKNYTPLAPSKSVNTVAAMGSGIPIYDFTKKYGNFTGRGAEAVDNLSSNIIKLTNQNSALGNPTIERIIELLTTIAQNTTNNKVLPGVLSILKSCLQVISTMNNSGTDVNDAQIASMNNELLTMMNKLDSLSKAV